jgi:hypothetical protein
MGFYLRKSVSVGPFRFNLSKSGVGVSTGVRGFRVGTGPRGNYVHMGRHGLYYRAALPPRPGRPTPPSLPTNPLAGDALKEIESGDVSEMKDSSSAELLAEFDRKRKTTRVAPTVAVVGAVAVFVLLASDVPGWFTVAAP